MIPRCNHHLTGNLDDTIDVDGLNLHDLRETKKVSEKQYSRMEELEARRRALLRELQNAKSSLDIVHKTENFNDATGAC
jgi:hypothetical protein